MEYTYMANLTLIHKGGEANQICIYKPTSLTSILTLYKVIKHIVIHHITKILDTLLDHRQHWFPRYE